MTNRRLMIRNACLVHGALSLMLACQTARGDGGALRISQPAGDQRVSVFTSPTPLRVGRVDVSVFVQDAATSRQASDAVVFVVARPGGNRSQAIRRQATAEQAANKLFQAAEFELPEAGRWEFTIEVGETEKPATIAFEADVAPPWPPWLALAPWIGWPWLAVALFCASRFFKLSGA